MKRYLILIVLTGCSSVPNKLEHVNTAMEVQGKIGDSKIGINVQNQAIVQNERSAEDELRSQIWKNFDLESEANYGLAQLKRCKNELADPRLDGNGQVTDTPEIDSKQQEAKEEFGVDDNGLLKVVRRQLYVDNLANAKRYEQTLLLNNKLIRKSLESCERDLGYARVKHGLPALRVQGKGHFEDGQWIQDRTAENSLDDAFNNKKGE